MTRSDFDFYMDNVVLELYKEIKHIDDEKFSGNSIKISRRRIPLIYYYYESFRKDMRKLYMMEDSRPMDRHKIASNMMFSIIKAKIVKIKRTISNLPIEILLANEYLGFYCALNILEMYKNQDENYKLENYSLIFPDTYIKEESNMSYVENTCKALYYTKHYTISDILAYANILFFLEKYTDTISGL